MEIEEKVIHSDARLEAICQKLEYMVHNTYSVSKKPKNVNL